MRRPQPVSVARVKVLSARAMIGRIPPTCCWLQTLRWRMRLFKRHFVAMVTVTIADVPHRAEGDGGVMRSGASSGSFAVLFNTRNENKMISKYGLNADI